MIVDVWMQHPTLRFLGHDMFASLRRWTGQAPPEEEVPIAATVASMELGFVGLRVVHPGRPHGADAPVRDGPPHPLRRPGGARLPRARRLPAVELRPAQGQFGTNYPMILPERALEDLDALGLDDETRELFLAGNARHVLGVPREAE